MIHRITALAPIVLLSTQSWAGSISSGGGELLGDATNPWFLEAAPGEPSSLAIKYCLDVGPDFVVAKKQLQKIVKESIFWWKSQLGEAHIPNNRITTTYPNFIQVRVKPTLTGIAPVETCDDAVDLRFQFGALTESQLKDLKDESIDPTKFVGMTIRNDYSKSMRGKGYIYISPDRGPLAMKSPLVAAKVWEIDAANSSNALALIIRHELGHVLGVPHLATGLMGAKTPETTVESPYDDFVSKSLRQPIFFPGEMRLDSCDREKKPDLFRFFNVPADDKCVGVYAVLSQFSAWTKQDYNTKQKFFIEQDLTNGYKRRFRDLMSIALPGSRDVFKFVPDYVHTLKGPTITEVLQDFTIKFGGTEHSIFIQRDPDRFQLGGLMDGKVFPDLFPQGSNWEL